MDFLTKEKSKQKRKGVNNQNNSIELFPVINTGTHNHHYSLLINLIFTVTLS